MENIEVSRKRFGYFPQIFEWRDEQHEVSRVIKCWTLPKSGAGGVERYCFFVESDEQFFTLYLDAADGSWRVLT